jgi:hypothetical protein
MSDWINPLEYSNPIGRATVTFAWAYGLSRVLGLCDKHTGSALGASLLGEAWRWAEGTAKWAADQGLEKVQQVIAFVQDTLNSFGLGGLVAPVTSWLTSTIQGLREWLQRTGVVGSMLLALFAGMLILRVRA